MIPVSAWLPVQPVVYLLRTPSNLRKAVAQLNVEKHARYKPFVLNGKTVTWCNIFRWDATRTLGVEVPHWYFETSGEVAGHHAPGAREMTANTVAAWFDRYGQGKGWKEVSRREAEQEAQKGNVVVCNWKNDAGHGHEAIMLPDGKVIQAGAVCGAFALETVFPHPLAVRFWRHE